MLFPISVQIGKYCIQNGIVMEEALKCGGLAAVVGEVQDISFTASRRLQLAVEQSGVTGFESSRGLPHRFLQHEGIARRPRVGAAPTRGVCA